MFVRIVYLLLLFMLGPLHALFADEWLSVKNYAAKGDSVADDTYAIQTAINESVTQYGYQLKAFPRQKGQTHIYFGVAKTWINNYNIAYVDGARQGSEVDASALIDNFAVAASAYPTLPILRSPIFQDSQPGASL